MGRADHRGCGLAIRKPHLETFIIAAVLEAIESPELGRWSMDLSSDVTRDNESLQQIEAARATLSELGALLASGAVTTAAWAAAVRPLEDRIRAAETDIATRARQSIGGRYQGRASELRDIWDQLQIDRQRAVIAAVVDYVEIAPVGKGHGRFDPNRIRIVWKS